MAGFKVPSFEERAAASKAAKTLALQKLRNASGSTRQVDLDEASVISSREVAAAERRAAHRAAIEQEKAARVASRAQAEADKQAAAEARRPKTPPKVTTPSELQAARDARYAARKERQRS